MAKAVITNSVNSELQDSVVSHACQEFGKLQKALKLLSWDAVPGSAEEKANDALNMELYYRELLVARSIAEARATTLLGHRARAIACQHAREFVGKTWMESDSIILILGSLVRDLAA